MTIPNSPVEVEPGLLLADLVTLVSCDQAFDRLMHGITSIEQQLDRTPSANEPEDWRRRARAALRYKKMMLPRLQEHRAGIKRAERSVRHDEAQQVERFVVKDKRRILFDILQEIAPQVLERVVAVAAQRHPELFDHGMVEPT